MKNALFLFLMVLAVKVHSQDNGLLYQVEFELVEKTNGQAVLIVEMNIAEGSRYLSPYSDDSFSGRFGVHFEENEDLISIGRVTETPRSYKVYDPHPFVTGFANWVYGKTRYEYPLHLKDSAQLEITGEVRFTIEPRCTYERISFIIKRKNGKVFVERFAC